MVHLDVLRVRRDSQLKTVIPTYQNPPAPIEDEEEDGGSLLGGICSALGGVLKTLDKPRGAAIGALSGENPMESLSNIVAGWRDPDRFSGRNIGFVRHAPDEDIVGSFSLRDILGGIGDVAFDPITIATAGAGGPISAGLKGVRGLRRVAPLVEPIIGRGSFRQRLLAETAVGVGAIAGGAAAEEAGIPGGQLVGGLAGALVTAGGIGAVDAAGRSAREAALVAADPRVQEFGRGRFEDVTPRATVAGGSIFDRDPQRQRELAAQFPEQNARNLDALVEAGDTSGIKLILNEKRTRLKVLQDQRLVEADVGKPMTVSAEEFALMDEVKDLVELNGHIRQTRDLTKLREVRIDELETLDESRAQALRQIDGWQKRLDEELEAGAPSPNNATDQLNDWQQKLSDIDSRIANLDTAIREPLPARPGTPLREMQNLQRDIDFAESLSARTRGDVDNKRSIIEQRREGLETGKLPEEFDQDLDALDPINTRSEELELEITSDVEALRALDEDVKRLRTQMDELVSANATLPEPNAPLMTIPDPRALRAVPKFPLGGMSGGADPKFRSEFPELRTTFSDEEGLIAIRAEGPDITPPERGLALREGEPAAATGAETRVRGTDLQALKSIEAQERALILSTKAEIKAEALARGLTPKSSMTKPELIDLILKDLRSVHQAPLYVGSGGTFTARRGDAHAATQRPKVIEMGAGDDFAARADASGFPPDIQAAVDEISQLHPKHGGQLGWIETVNQTFKNIWATADSSWLGIQGLLVTPRFLTGRNPGAIGDLFKETLLTMFKGDRSVNMFGRYDETARAVGAPTVAELIDPRGLERPLHIASIAGIADIGLTAPSKIPGLNRFNEVFAASGDVARLHAVRMEWLRHGKTTDLQGVVDAVNRATGIGKHDLLGNAGRLFLFAPRFIQSQLETIGKSFELGTIEGDIARKQIASFVGIGVVLTYGANESRGEETVFDPTDSNFMRIRNVAGADISLFGPWDSLVRGIARFGDDPQDAAKFLVRSKASPLVSIAWDLLSQKTFFGDDLTPERFAKGLLLPFAWQDISNEPPLGVAAGFFGLKASPMTALELLDLKMKNADLDPKDPLTRRQWLVDHPEDLPKARAGERQLADETRQDIAARAELNELRTQGGTQTLEQFRENRRILQRELHSRLDSILGEFTRRKPETQQDEWIQSWFNLFDNARDQVTGDINGVVLDKLQGDWLNTFGEEALTYVNDFNLVGRQPLESEYLRDIKQLNDFGFFDMPRFVRMKSGLTDNSILDLRQQVVTARLGDTRLAGAEFSTAARVYLGDLGYSNEVVRDVVNSGKDAFISPQLRAFRNEHPELLIWFNPNATIQTLRSLQANPGGSRTRRGLRR